MLHVKRVYLIAFRVFSLLVNIVLLFILMTNFSYKNIFYIAKYRLYKSTMCTYTLHIVLFDKCFLRFLCFQTLGDKISPIFAWLRVRMIKIKRKRE